MTLVFFFRCELLAACQVGAFSLSESASSVQFEFSLQHLILPHAFIFPPLRLMHQTNACNLVVYKEHVRVEAGGDVSQYLAA